jgi:hypothetical protein
MLIQQPHVNDPPFPYPLLINFIYLLIDAANNNLDGNGPSILGDSVELK